VLTFPLCATSPPTHLVPPTLFPYTTLFRSIWSFWSPVTSPSTQFVASESDGHRNTETCTRSYQKSFICPTCICSRIAAPTKSRDTKVTSTTETTIEKFLRRPDQTSERMKPALMRRLRTCPLR